MSEVNGERLAEDLASRLVIGTNTNHDTNQSIATRNLLYMDAMNFAREFFCHADHAASILGAHKKISSFCMAAEKSGWTVVAFIDMACVSEEAMTKWKQRREREIRMMERRMPQGMSLMMGDAFHACGVEVRFSAEADCDDTIASHAQLDGAQVLSQDSDFFRYKGASYTVFQGFTIVKGQLALIPHERSSIKPGTKARGLLNPCPGTRPIFDALQLF
jgi:hypothetical protein